MNRSTRKHDPIITVPTSPALELWETLQAAGITLRAGANGRIIANPGHALTAEMAAAIKEHRAAILDYLATGHLGALVPADAPAMPYEHWHTLQLEKQAAEQRRKNKEL